jgi:hypothetical protein
MSAPPCTPDSWTLAWRTFNADPFQAITGLALVGALGLVIPALLGLPGRRDVKHVGESVSRANAFNRLRSRVVVLGAVASLLSLAGAALYGWLFFLLEGDPGACIPDERLAHGLLVSLIGTSTVAVLLVGVFYFTLRQLRPDGPQA